MKYRLFIIGLFVVLCLGALWAVVARQQQMAALQDEQKGLLARLAVAPANPMAAADRAPPEPTMAAATVSSELLKLRAEVTRLTERKLALAGVAAENKILQAKATARATNGPAGAALPPGFLQRTNARFMGYNTAEDTLQSLMWAIENRDITNCLQAFEPKTAEQIRAAVETEGHSGESMLEQARQKFEGIAILSRRELPDGSIELEVDDGTAAGTQHLSFRQIDGQWKLSPPQ